MTRSWQWVRRIFHTCNTLLLHEIEGGAAASGDGPCLEKQGKTILSDAERSRPADRMPSRFSLKRSLEDVGLGGGRPASIFANLFATSEQVHRLQRKCH